ncbi:tRNA (adenosine(37)-N6)-threonylcarbamoyltransferase complex dimerization subunit type 1 TsaB [Candidatus Dependentiae bacterium]|nr:tRNA (adenosine(37)-N6)-threonylcarbamoyltransferase complex dimerization subunit type 1 TsaB [Candidatus Dependentiae bacterium]
MVVFLVIHARYKDVQWGLFKNGTLIEAAADESKKVSKNFLTMLGFLLQKHELSLSDLSFIAAHIGPAPLTTLRVSLATINGFSFAQGIPLVGVNGLEGLLDEHSQLDRVTVALLNAFCQEVYYGIDDPLEGHSQRTLHKEEPLKASTNSVSRGYGRARAEEFIPYLAKHYPGPLSLVGNGVELYAALIETHLGKQACPLSYDIVSLETIAHKGLAQWRQGIIDQQLIPLYFKGNSALPLLNVTS